MSKLIPLLMLCFLVTMSSSAQTIYTWVDKHGVVHFSDTPIDDNSTALELPDVATSPAPEVIAESQQPDPSVEEQTELKDEALDIADEPFFSEAIEPLEIRLVEPKNDEVIRSNNGNFIVRVDLNRDLTVGEQMQLWLNEKPYHAPQLDTEWELKNIDRGTHRIQVRATESGKQIASSLSIIVHLKRASVLN